jgi:hypothetical protein
MGPIGHAHTHEHSSECEARTLREPELEAEALDRQRGAERRRVPARYLWGYGLIEASVARRAAALDGQEIGSQSILRRGPLASRDEAVAFLSHLTHPATRLALLPLGDRWTAVLDNRRNGAEPRRSLRVAQTQQVFTARGSR